MYTQFDISAEGVRTLEEWIVMSLRGHQGFWRLHRLCTTQSPCSASKRPSVSRRWEKERDRARYRNQLLVRSKGPGASGPIHGGPAKCWQHPPWHHIRFLQGLQNAKRKIEFVQFVHVRTVHCVYHSVHIS